MESGGTSDRRLHVLIVGAGTVGLLVAQGLKKAGISFEVFEAEPTASYYRAREWGTSLQWALPMLPQLLPESLMARLTTAAVDPHYKHTESSEYSMPCYDASKGELLKMVPLGKFIRVSRHKFRALCAEDIDVQYNKNLSNATTTSTASTDSITLTFADSTTRTGTLVMDASGARSHLRNLVFGAQKGPAQPMPYKAINMHVRYGDSSIARRLRSAFAPNETMAIGFHPSGYWLWLSVQDVPDPDDASTWVFQLQWTWAAVVPADAKPTLEHLQAVAAREFSPASLFWLAWTAIPPDTAVFENSISVWAPRGVPADSPLAGRVALAGDAAHAMSFHRGQGLNHGIADAVGIVKALDAVQKGEKGLGEAVAAYEAEVVARAGEEVRTGMMNTEMVHEWDKLMDSPFMKMGGARNT